MSRYGFEAQLRNFDQEATAVAKYIYAEMAIQHAASQSKRLLDRLNQTPDFWSTCEAALQAAGYIALARVFDTKSKFNIDALLNAMEKELGLFRRSKLAERKRDGQPNDPPWLSEYLDHAYYPTSRDVDRIRLQVARRRTVYERAVKPARNKYIAHREKHAHAEVQALFASGKVNDLWNLSTFLVNLHQTLWDQLNNGRKVVVRRTRFSIKSIYRLRDHRQSPQQVIVSDVRLLMERLEASS